ncbi:hypothetical protein [Yoonia sp. 2307UL14-13]|uniref:hypothetical protein n=1 Tax=Yoonia sp. 2307UL14-13 TaxID=3126506 RepID=UPI0030B12C2B
MTETPSWTAFIKAAEIAGPPRPSLAWAKAKRTQMKVFDDRVEIGSWTLKHSDVTSATLYQTQSGIKNRVFEIATPDQTVQINFNPGTSPEGHLPYPIQTAPFPKGLAVFRIIFWLFIAAIITAAIFT